MFDQAAIDTATASICAPLIEAIAPLAVLTEEQIDECAAWLLLSSSAGVEVPESDIGVVIKWLRVFHMQANIIQMALAGAIDISVQDGSVAVGIRSPDRLMERMTAAGLAKPVDEVSR